MSWVTERVVIFEISELAGEIDDDWILGIGLETKYVFLALTYLGVRKYV